MGRHDTVRASERTDRARVRYCLFNLSTRFLNGKTNRFRHDAAQNEIIQRNRKQYADDWAGMFVVRVTRLAPGRRKPNYYSVVSRTRRRRRRSWKRGWVHGKFTGERRLSGGFSRRNRPLCKLELGTQRSQLLISFTLSRTVYIWKLVGDIFNETTPYAIALSNQDQRGARMIFFSSSHRWDT